MIIHYRFTLSRPYRSYTTHDLRLVNPFCWSRYCGEKYFIKRIFTRENRLGLTIKVGKSQFEIEFPMYYASGMYY